MYTDIKSLNKFDEKAFCQLVDIVFSFLVSPKEGTRFMSQVSEFAGEHGVSTNALKNVVKSLLGFFKSALKSNLTPAQVKEDLEHLGRTVHDKHPHKHWKIELYGMGYIVVCGRKGFVLVRIGYQFCPFLLQIGYSFCTLVLNWICFVEEVLFFFFHHYR